MIKQINSYKELLEEKARLNALLIQQELMIKEDWHSIKEDLRPAVLVGGTLKRLFTRRSGFSAAQLGVNLLADGLIKKVLLSKTGWLTRWLIPFLVKNYASHIVDKPGNLIRKLKKLFSKNGKMHHETGMDAV